MIKLGKLTDYAIVLMGQLAKEGIGTSRSAHYLSDKTGVPEPTVAKVLKKLANKSLIASVRGAAGGYKLSRGAEQISVAEIVTALDGPIAVVTCVKGNKGACAAKGGCPVRGNWDHLNRAITSALEGVSLASIMADRR
ncbi:MAG: SUF system Fe-S cluster assembly regulator [Pseudomonadota bacterium]